MTAIREHRVMTIHHAPRGQRADYGTIGLSQREAGGQILIFPKSLRRWEGRRIVGIDYRLLAAAERLRPAREEAPPLHVPSRAKEMLPVPAPSHAHPHGPAHAPAALSPASGRGPKPRPKPIVDKVVPMPMPPLTWALVRREVEHVRRDLKAGKAAAAELRLASLARRLKSMTG